MTIADAIPSDRATTDLDAGHESELVFFLYRAKIVLEPTRFAAVAAEYVAFRVHVDLVNRSFAPSDEPALVFDPRPLAQR